MSKSFLLKENRDTLQRMSNMIRYNNAVHIHNENVAEHSFYVSVYALSICDFFGIRGKMRSIAIEKALIHDVHEIEISDIPHNVKHNIPGLNEACVRYEEEYNKENFGILYEEFESLPKWQKQIVNSIVDLADILSVRQYSQQEVEFGNLKRFGEILDSSSGRIKKCLLTFKEYFNTSQVKKLEEMLK